MSIDADLAERLRLLEDRVAAATQQMRAGDPDPGNAFRGLYITDEQIDRLMDSDRLDTAEPIESADVANDSVIGRLVADFGLDALDVEILVVALAPDLDRRFEQFYGYLHDDVTRRRASPGLAISLLGESALDSRVRQRFVTDAPLVLARLIEIEDGDRPFLSRAIRVPDRVTSHLLGSTVVDADLSGVATAHSQQIGPLSEGLARAIVAAGPALYLREPGDHGAASVAATGFQIVGREPLVIDLLRADPALRLDLAELAVREARLSGRGLVVGPVDDFDEATVRALTETRPPLIMHGRSVWDPARTTTPVVVIDVAQPTGTERLEWWEKELPDSEGNIHSVASAFRLGPSQIRRAVAAGRGHADVVGGELDLSALAAGARTQNSAGLERLARRLVPDASWDDIVLPPDTTAQLAHIVDRVSRRSLVLDEWGLRRGGGRGEGIAALFAGDSGTGKTLAAEVIAHTVGLDLYVIDLSTVVDKYVGETEKNLERIFTEAEGVNGVLFFDEADALFGKRSEVSDARDRYANIEVAFLLQRMEQFDGLAVLASNLRGNLDEAFARRLSVVVDFPDPDTALRRRLWLALLGDVPLGADVDLDFLAQSFELTGGNIRNVAVTAAYLSAEAGSIGMASLIRGVQLEYRKLGRLCLPTEFGIYLPLLEEVEAAERPNVDELILMEN